MWALLKQFLSVVQTEQWSCKPLNLLREDAYSNPSSGTYNPNTYFSCFFSFVQDKYRKNALKDVKIVPFQILKYQLFMIICQSYLTLYTIHNVWN